MDILSITVRHIPASMLRYFLETIFWFGKKVANVEGSYGGMEDELDWCARCEIHIE